ncbi:MAG: hypothetical protein P4L51_21475 [Puia sp.]|nr:hypothetical protein [Puia sp.]
MELKKLREHWAGFPVVSMEERPVLISEMENMLVKSPFTREFYLRNKILFRIAASLLLLLVVAFQVRNETAGTGGEPYFLFLLAATLAGFMGFNIHLLFFADYPSLASLSLVPFLDRIENIFQRYIHSFKILSLLAGFYAQMLLECILRSSNAGLYQSIRENTIYRILILAFLSISAYILLLSFRINKYKKRMLAVRTYKEGISDTARKH